MITNLHTLCAYTVIVNSLKSPFGLEKRDEWLSVPSGLDRWTGGCIPTEVVNLTLPQKKCTLISSLIYRLSLFQYNGALSSWIE